MKNIMTNIKANKAAIIKRTFIVAATVAAIALVGYVYTRSEDISIDITDLPEGGFMVTPVIPES